MMSVSIASDISAWIVDRIVFYGKVAAGSFDLDTPLTDLGLDSIYALSLCADIEDVYGLEVDPAIFDELPSIRLLADGISARLGTP
jgi:acyl carrier protein